MKAQLKMADRAGAAFVAIIGRAGARGRYRDAAAAGRRRAEVGPDGATWRRG